MQKLFELAFGKSEIAAEKRIAGEVLARSVKLRIEGQRPAVGFVRVLQLSRLAQDGAQCVEDFWILGILLRSLLQLFDGRIELAGTREFQAAGIIIAGRVRCYRSLCCAGGEG